MGCCNSAVDENGDKKDGDEFNDIGDDGKVRSPSARPKSKPTAATTARGKQYAANSAGDGSDAVVDMDQQVASVLAKPLTAAPAAASTTVQQTVSSSSSSSSDDDEASPPAAAAPPPPPPVVMMQRKDPNSLALSEAELEEARRKREEAKKEAGVETKAMEIFFDSDDAAGDGEGHMDPDAECGVVEDFSAAMTIPSPKRNLGVEGRDDAPSIPTPEWFAERGVQPPKSVVWYQSGDSIFVEITPANDDAGYGISDGNRLFYNCSLSAAGPAAPETFSPTDIILYTTTVSGNTITKQHCRDMERILYLHQLQAHVMDLGEHGFMRKMIIQQCGGKDLGLPLLFVGERCIGTSEEVQTLVDKEQFLATLGPEAVAKAKAAAESPTGADEVFRLELTLLGKVQGPHWAVVPSNRPAAQPGDKMLTLRAAKLGDPPYWPQLVKGTMAEIKALSWLSRDLTREADSDEEEDAE